MSNNLLATAYQLLNGDSDSKIEEGMKCIDKLLKMKPNNRDALVYKGIALSKLNKNEEALLCLNNVISKFPRYYLGYMNKGTVLFALKRYQSALDAFNKSIELSSIEGDGQNADLHFNKANCLFSLDRFEEALKSYKRASSIDPSDHVFLLRIGDCLRELKKFKESVVEYKAALRINPEEEECYFHIGNILKNEIEDYSEAMKYFNKLILIDPDNSCPMLNKADCLMKLQKWEKAVQFYDKAFETISRGFVNVDDKCCKSRYDIQFNKSVCFYNLKKNEPALDCVNKCIQLHPNDIHLYVQKRIILLAMKKFEEAADCEIEELKLEIQMKL